MVAAFVAVSLRFSCPNKMRSAACFHCWLWREQQSVRWRRVSRPRRTAHGTVREKVGNAFLKPTPFHKVHRISSLFWVVLLILFKDFHKLRLVVRRDEKNSKFQMFANLVRGGSDHVPLRTMLGESCVFDPFLLCARKGAMQMTFCMWLF